MDDEKSRNRGVKHKHLPSPAASPLYSPRLQPRHPCLASNHGMGDSSIRLSKGQAVYVYKEEAAWQTAVVVEVDTSHSVVTVALDCTNEVSSFHLEDVLLCWENRVEDINNLTHINPVHEATILSCLQKRFMAGVYYTNAGNTVVAVNPFCDVSHLYTLQQIQAYHSRQQGLPPHIYPVAENAYISLLRQLGHVNQSIIISGESGAGKTESAKHLLRYLTIVANPATDIWSVDDKGFQIEQRVVDSNPILEAFGNAATMRNNNSSRFGKFIQLQFLRNGRIQGGAIHTYLLEKTRVMHQAYGENNFHVFYQMAGVTTQDGSYAGWVMGMWEEMATTSFICVPHNQDCSENAELKVTLDAMSRIGLSEDSQRQVFEVLLAILYLGNLSFVQVNDDNSGLEKKEGLSCLKDCADCDDFVMEVSVSDEALQRSSELLGLNPDHLRQTLLHRCLQAGGPHHHSVFVKPITVCEARSRRDILAMLLYSRLFEWLVGFINSRIRAESFDNVIGLLDIYGFEIFPTNSLEQLCINYANERLQQHYVAHFLKNLQMEYREECLQWVPIDYKDNRPCLNLLDGRLSIFSLLNEEVYLNRKSDAEALRERLLKLSSGSESCVRVSRLATQDCPTFIVQHYAGDVHYSVSDLVAKNKDDIPDDLVTLLTDTASSFLHCLFSSYIEPQSPFGRKRKTVLTKFKSSLDVLMSLIGESDVHYIRCLRPNVSNRPAVFQAPYVLQQLRACGTLESVNICRKGFPARMVYSDFLQRYSMVLRSEYRIPSGCDDSQEGHDSNDNDDDGGLGKEESTCDALDVQLRQQLDLAFPVSPGSSNCTIPMSRKRLRRYTATNVAVRHEQTHRVVSCILQAACSSHGDDLSRQFGHSKVFLTQQQLEELECARTAVLHHSATCLQSAWRGLCCRRQYRRYLAAITILRAWRAHQTRQEFLCLKQAIVLLKRAWKAFHTRRAFVTLRRMVVILQRTWRSVKARREFVRQRKSVVILQRAWRSLKRRKDFLLLRQAVMVVQRTWLCILTRRCFVRMRRSVVVLQSAWRTVRARRNLLRMRRATLVIQAAWSMWKARRRFLFVKQDAVVLQRGTQRWLHMSHQHLQDCPASESKDVAFTLQPLTLEERHSSPLKQPLTLAAEEDSPRSLADASFDTVDSQFHSTSSAQVFSDFSEQLLVHDGNQSDDSGVIVHEPVPRRKQNNHSKMGDGMWVRGKGTGRAVVEEGVVCWKRKLMLSLQHLPGLHDLHIGDSIISRRRIPKNGVQFHTRASVLRYGHVINRRELPYGLLDLLVEVSYGAQEMGTTVDP